MNYPEGIEFQLIGRCRVGFKSGLMISIARRRRRSVSGLVGKEFQEIQGSEFEALRIGGVLGVSRNALSNF